jgi:hypothetical protein
MNPAGDTEPSGFMVWQWRPNVVAERQPVQGARRGHLQCQGATGAGATQCDFSIRTDRHQAAATRGGQEHTSKAVTSPYWAVWNPFALAGRALSGGLPLSACGRDAEVAAMPPARSVCPPPCTTNPNTGWKRRLVIWVPHSRRRCVRGTVPRLACRDGGHADLTRCAWLPEHGNRLYRPQLAATVDGRNMQAACMTRQ